MIYINNNTIFDFNIEDLAPLNYVAETLNFFELNNFTSLLSFKRIYFFMEEFLLSIHLSKKSVSFKAFRKSELNPTSTTLNFDLK